MLPTTGTRSAALARPPRRSCAALGLGAKPVFPCAWLAGAGVTALAAPEGCAAGCEAGCDSGEPPSWLPVAGVLESVAVVPADWSFAAGEGMLAAWSELPLVAELVSDPCAGWLGVAGWLDALLDAEEPPRRLPAAGCAAAWSVPVADAPELSVVDAAVDESLLAGVGAVLSLAFAEGS